jgi:hypothetical protein
VAVLRSKGLEQNRRFGWLSGNLCEVSRKGSDVGIDHSRCESCNCTLSAFLARFRSDLIEDLTVRRSESGSGVSNVVPWIHVRARGSE